MSAEFLMLATALAGLVAAKLALLLAERCAAPAREPRREAADAGWASGD